MRYRDHIRSSETDNQDIAFLELRAVQEKRCLDCRFRSIECDLDIASGGCNYSFNNVFDGKRLAIPDIIKAKRFRLAADRLFDAMNEIVDIE